MNEDLLDRLIRARLEQLVKQRVAQGPGESRASVYLPQDQKPHDMAALPRYQPIIPPRISEQAPPEAPPRRTQDDEDEDLLL